MFQSHRSHYRRHIECTPRATATDNSHLSQAGLVDSTHEFDAALVSKLTRQHQSESDARSCTHWSHVVVLVFSKFTHHFGLNNLCDIVG